MMSGGPIKKFRRGWCVALFAGRVAHHFERIEASPVLTSDCRKVTVVVAALREAGTFKRCQLCERLPK